MTAKEWLSRARYIDTEIRQLKMARTELYLRTTSMVTSTDNIIVQGGKNPHKFDRLVELNSKITDQIEKLNEMKSEIIDVVQEVPDSRYRTLLLCRYIRMLTWEKVAVEMNYSYPQTVRMHGDALQVVDGILKRMGRL